MESLSAFSEESSSASNRFRGSIETHLKSRTIENEGNHGESKMGCKEPRVDRK